MALRNAELFGNLDLSKSAGVKLADFSNGLFIKFSVGVLFALSMISVIAPSSPKNIDGVTDVLGRGGEFQVIESVIGFDSVFMVDLHSFWNWAGKSGNDSSVNEHVTASAFPAIA